MKSLTYIFLLKGYFVDLLADREFDAKILSQFEKTWKRINTFNSSAGSALELGVADSGSQLGACPPVSAERAGAGAHKVSQT